MKRNTYPAFQLCLAFVMLLWLGAFAILADTHYAVPPGTDGMTSGVPYNTWTNAATNIQWALDVAESNDIVLVTNGIYTTIEPRYWAQTDVETNYSIVCITNPIILRSANGPTSTFINGNYNTITARCVFMANGATLDGFTVMNGLASNTFCSRSGDANGGGVYIYAMTNYDSAYAGTVTNCHVCSNNAQKYGAGIYAAASSSDQVNSTMVVANCSVYTNFGANGSHGAGMCVGGGNSNSVGRTYVLNSLIFSNGTGQRPTFGGGIYSYAVENMYTIVSNCTISYNMSDNAGGSFYLYNAEVVDCVMTNNAGGVSTITLGGSNSIMRNCSIVNNGFAGRGVTYLLNKAVISNCLVANNRSSGGLSLNNATADRCVISNNYSSDGKQSTAGGGDTVGGGVTLRNESWLKNSLVCNNTNNANGGGVCLSNGTLNSYMVNCTIVSNYCTTNGGGIFTRGESNLIYNSVIARNRSAANSDLYHLDATNTNNFYYTCVNTNLAPSQGNITNDPSFVNASARDWRLSQDSPCLNTGTNMSWMTNAYDLDGQTRIRYGTVDMGAYETIYDGTFFTAQ